MTEDITRLIRQAARRWRGQVTLTAFLELVQLEIRRYMDVLWARGACPLPAGFCVALEEAGLVVKIRVEVGRSTPIVVDITQESSFVPWVGVA